MSIDFVRWRRSSVLAGIVVKLRNSLASDEARSNCRFSYLIVVVALFVFLAAPQKEEGKEYGLGELVLSRCTMAINTRDPARSIIRPTGGAHTNLVSSPMFRASNGFCFQSERR